MLAFERPSLESKSSALPNISFPADLTNHVVVLVIIFSIWKADKPRFWRQTTCFQILALPVMSIMTKGRAPSLSDSASSCVKWDNKIIFPTGLEEGRAQVSAM